MVDFVWPHMALMASFEGSLSRVRACLGLRICEPSVLKLQTCIRRWPHRKLRAPSLGNAVAFIKKSDLGLLFCIDIVRNPKEDCW